MKIVQHFTFSSYSHFLALPAPHIAGLLPAHTAVPCPSAAHAEYTQAEPGSDHYSAQSAKIASLLLTSDNIVAEIERLEIELKSIRAEIARLQKEQSSAYHKEDKTPAPATVQFEQKFRAVLAGLRQAQPSLLETAAQFQHATAKKTKTPPIPATAPNGNPILTRQDIDRMIIDTLARCNGYFKEALDSEPSSGLEIIRE